MTIYVLGQDKLLYTRTHAHTKLKPCSAKRARSATTSQVPGSQHIHTQTQHVDWQDVLAVLLNNLKVQERQNRVCTTVAIAIVAETCGPFTVLPALLNEYRLPELNVLV